MSEVPLYLSSFVEVPSSTESPEDARLAVTEIIGLAIC